MVKELLQIPERLQAIEYSLQAERPKVSYGAGADLQIEFKDVSIPPGMVPRFLRQCGIRFKWGDALGDLAGRVERALAGKSLTLRGKLEKNEISWFGIVTDEFKPVYPRDVHAILRGALGDTALARHFSFQDVVHLDYPADPAIPDLRVHVNTGAFGLYGGNARTALRTGLSWYNPACKNWTLFLEDYLWENSGRKERVIHRGNGSFYHETLTDKLIGMKGQVGRIVRQIEGSKAILLSRQDADLYFSLYSGKEISQRLRRAVLGEVHSRISVYELASLMTSLCQGLTKSDGARERVEYLAGELILCHNRIFS